MKHYQAEFEVQTIPIRNVFPSVVNGKVYQPVSRDDPTIQELANSIRTHGVREPLVITKDGDIVSGHRRYAAAKLAGLTEIPCRVLNITSEDPEFLRLLVEYNKHRIKSADELLREAVVNINSKQAHQRLIEHRREQSRLSEDPFALHKIRLRGERTRCAISSAKKPFLEAIQKVVEDNRRWWSLSDRQIHYLLVSGDPPLIHAAKADSVYSNTKKSYKALVELLTRARLNNVIPWQAINDPTRPVITWEVHRNPETFLSDQLKSFLTGYYRDLQQSQPNHIEILAEKNTLKGIIDSVAARYTIPYTIGRGYCSLQPRRQLVDRLWRSGKENLILLCLSDFDPDGEEIAHSFARSLRDDFAVRSEKIQPIKVALTADQVDELGLLPIMSAKESSANYDRFVQEQGNDDVYELEAVEPSELQRMLEEAIESVIDSDVLDSEIEAEKEDAAFLEAKRAAIFAMLQQTGLAEEERATSSDDQGPGATEE
jgi:ParB/RepB/Spo0J family partition protein